MLTFRDAIRKVSPNWLRRGNAERLLYTIGLHLDFLVEATAAAIKFRFPGYYSPESLPYEGRQRRISRGRHETDAGYADRLTRWLDDHRTRGNPITLLRQLHAHFAPNNFPIELIYASGRRFMMAADGTITWDDVAWTPPGDPEKWARWWLFYHAPQFATPPPNWGEDEATWGSGQVWGSGLSPEDVADLKLVPVAWNNARSIGHLVILDEGESWDTYEPGTWPRQIALTNMTDPLTPVEEYDLAVIPPEDGRPVLAHVVCAAFQKVINSIAFVHELNERRRPRAARFVIADTTGSPATAPALTATFADAGIEVVGGTKLKLPQGRWRISWSAMLGNSNNNTPQDVNLYLRKAEVLEASAPGRRESTSSAVYVPVANSVVVQITDPNTELLDLMTTSGTTISGSADRRLLSVSYEGEIPA